MSHKRSFMVKRIAAVLVGLACLFSASSLMAQKRYAAIFATNYKDNAASIPPLDLCERDATLIKKTLLKHGNYDDVTVFLGRKVTAKAVKSTLTGLARKVGKNDTVILFFAGHGTYQRDAKAKNGLRNTLVMFERPHITDDQLNGWLKGIRTTKFLWIFDCCFSGGIVKKGNRTRRGTGEIPIAPGQKGKVIENGDDDFYFQNKAIVGSSDSNETSIEIGGKINHGVFSYFFAQGVDPKNGDLNRDKVVTALEAFEWSAKRVTGMAKKFNHRQHPQISGNASGILLAGRRAPKPPRPSPGPAPVKPKPPGKDPDGPKPSPIKPPPTPSKPDKPVTPDEPPVVNHPVKSDIKIFTTIFKSVKGGYNPMDPVEILRRNRMADRTRKVQVVVSGKIYPAKVRWLNRRQLKRLSGEDVPMGSYKSGFGRYKYNRMAYIQIKKVPTGVHEIEIRADGYPVIKRRLGVEKQKGNNKLFVVASLAGYGTIQGKVFYKNFDTPMRGQTIWMPVVKYPNQTFKMTSLRDGSFWFINLPPADDYFIKASFLENLPLDNKKLTVSSGAVTKVDVVLSRRLGGL